MVITLPVILPVTPGGRPLNVAPEAMVVLYVILVIGPPWQTVWLSVPAAEVLVMVHGVVPQLVHCTVVVRQVFWVPHPAVFQCA